ncbi:hypothetical protein CLV96_3857 [Leptospira meyeri]|uniref:Uncharacterized protein n=1 Tax=Leptospira meyeri TaxID=29508 RepID=A0A4R8MK66_LEPME|nr:hypothetical protein [Leptospira meyeri]EKJ86035.1 hypothetical protein LEP1GSC017_0395 [Leptospira meyeri serovar Hardjo str. Went 5]TDY66747.1 hypothetical protein CLV96_3857 [Leptospira meyeri]
MGNTTRLIKIEQVLRERFLKEYGITSLNTRELLGTKPDVIGEKGGTLILGEITVSGFKSNNGNKFHIGGARKLSEAFLKLFILKERLSEINKVLSRDFKKVEICFIYPKNTGFMEALGYREYIFSLGVLKKCPIEIDSESIETISEVLKHASEEMKNDKN